MSDTDTHDGHRGSSGTSSTGRTLGRSVPSDVASGDVTGATAARKKPFNGTGQKLSHMLTSVASVRVEGDLSEGSLC
jgi:hypothetical protein